MYFIIILYLGSFIRLWKGVDLGMGVVGSCKVRRKKKKKERIIFYPWWQRSILSLLEIFKDLEGLEGFNFRVQNKTEVMTKRILKSSSRLDQFFDKILTRRGTGGLFAQMPLLAQPYDNQQLEQQKWFGHLFVLIILILYDTWLMRHVWYDCIICIWLCGSPCTYCYHLTVTPVSLQTANASLAGPSLLEAYNW